MTTASEINTMIFLLDVRVNRIKCRINNTMYSYQFKKGQKIKRKRVN